MGFFDWLSGLFGKNAPPKPKAVKKAGPKLGKVIKPGSGGGIDFAQIEAQAVAQAGPPATSAAAGPVLTECRKLRGHKGWVSCLAVSPDGQWLLSAGEDKTLRIWDLKHDVEMKTFSGHKEPINTVCWSPDGTRIASGGGLSTDNVIRIWDVASGRELKQLVGHRNTVHALTWTVDGKMLISASGDRTIRMWEPNLGKALFNFRGKEAGDKTLYTGTKAHHEAVFGLAVLPDGKRAVSGSDDESVRLWNLESCIEIRTLMGMQGKVRSVASSPDGKTVLVGSLERKAEKSVTLFSTVNGMPIKVFTGHVGAVNSVAISPDGKLGLSGGDDKIVRLWDLAAGRELCSFHGHTYTVPAVAFTRDGNHAISASRDSTINIWPIPAPGTL